MRTTKRSKNAVRLATAGALLLLSLGCSPEYELLSSRDAERGETAGAGGAGGSGAGGALAGGGGESASGGSTGGTGFSESGSNQGGVGLSGTGQGGTAQSACASHGTCGFGMVCSASQCTSCPVGPAACPACDHGFQSIRMSRNGCSICECVPTSACTRDIDCPQGEACYAGAQCQDGCTEPACCFGNRCSLPGCYGKPIPHCLVAGCAGGAVCLAACQAVTCACDGVAWQCAESPSSGGAPSGTCPQACAAP